MRRAARAAHLSLGGLYHYFPTKRDLVLHALKPQAVARLCAEFHGRHADLERSDLGRYVQADVDYMAASASSSARRSRPRSNWTPRLPGTTSRPASRVAWSPAPDRWPTRSPEEIRSLGRSVRRTFFSALVDRTVTPDEMRHELLSLIHGWPATVHHGKRLERRRVTALKQHAARARQRDDDRRVGHARA
jgi:AcrR family transcriptional regulator